LISSKNRQTRNRPNIVIIETMKILKNSFAAVIAFATIFSACQSNKNESQSAEATETEASGEMKPAFVANPQFIAKREVTTLEIGAKAPDFNLPGVDGKFYTLDDFSDVSVLVIIFTCNHCPTAQAYEDRIKAVVNDYKGKSVKLIAISPNSPMGLLYEELGYTDLNDDYTAMQLRADYMDYNFPYLYDGDTEEASLQYGPVATPHAFVFDSNRVLTYNGRLDKVEKPGTTNSEDLRAAIDATLDGKPIAEPVTKVFGCSTKWGWKTDMRERVDKDWNSREVKVEDIDLAGIKTLLKNDDSKKLRLINVWATWCGPCMLEYPEFIAIQRMYGARDFEFVSISADKLEKRDKVLEFLDKKESGVPNYIFTGGDNYAMVEAFGDGWDGALPYTALVEPGGKVVYEHQGEVDFLELKRAIVEHDMIGRVY
jgi:thiol-disulfide isomerase/thioredoxin